MSTHRTPSPARRLLAAAALVVVVAFAAACQTPEDTNGETGRAPVGAGVIA